ncbi:MAG: DNA endonuclease SmrA [Cellvibrionales bacterium]|nr:DNA endonuclease SmrA [Cellvibrionales bacterium]
MLPTRSVIVDDDNLFSQHLDGVKPLKTVDRAKLKKTVSSVSKAYQRQAAVGDHQSDLDNNSIVSVSDDYVDMVKSLDVLSFKRAGIQDGVFKKFRLGKYSIDGRLDLHRRTVVEARQEVFSFISEATVRDARCLLILHGKGERNINQQAKLKSYAAKWLKEIPQVMAFHSAQKHHGGTGALYVLLKKSERLKEKNRERLGRS